ncbi:MAG: PIN domain-containing protein [Burkholderiales bacterium]|nr:PIN domain-containing protein [Opitutaceae bacterium]
MTIYLPDTNVWSRYMRGHADDAVLCERVESHLFACRLSAIALMELEYGAAKRPDVPAFRDRILRLTALFPSVAVFDSACAHHAGVVRAQLATLRPNAQPIGNYDALLAGQAIALGAVFVTDNVAEFRRVPGLACENWRAR